MFSGLCPIWDVHSSYLSNTPGLTHCTRPSFIWPTAAVHHTSAMPVGLWTHRPAACGWLVFCHVGGVSAMYQVANFRCVNIALQRPSPTNTNALWLDNERTCQLSANMT